MGVATRTAVAVLYRDAERVVHVFDDGVRPPEPNGRWLDDIVAEACRLEFGCSNGSCRTVPGRADLLEFREAWPDAVPGKLVARVPVLFEPKGVEQQLVVSCRCVPGCDQEALILAEAQLACERLTRGGGLALWTPNRPSHITFRATGSPPGLVVGTVPCRYTVLRAGVAVEIVVDVPHAAVEKWPAILYSVRRECLRRFGPGRLAYSPEHGETFFTWG